jgi:hypothetical protein
MKIFNEFSCNGVECWQMRLDFLCLNVVAILKKISGGICDFSIGYIDFNKAFGYSIFESYPET